MNKKNTKRNVQIDVLKGIAILLVVIGHSIQSSYLKFDENIIFRYIYSFHMALFMFLSGYVQYGKTIDIKKKFLELAVPFLAWYQVFYLIKIVFYKSNENYFQYIYKLIISPDWGLWFLWILFLNLAYLKIVSQYVNKKAKFGDMVAFFSAWIVLNSVPLSIFGLGIMKDHFIYLATGYLFPKYSFIFKKIKKYFYPLVIILFIIFGFFWKRTSDPFGWNLASVYFSKFGIPGEKILLQIYKLTTTYLGIATIYILSPKKNGFIRTGLSYLGRKSFDIYVIHQSVLFGFNQNFLKVTSKVIISISMSLGLSKFLKQFSFLKIILFGKRKI